MICIPGMEPKRTDRWNVVDYSDVFWWNLGVNSTVSLDPSRVKVPLYTELLHIYKRASSKENPSFLHFEIS